jgi:hypothetical protein
MKKRMAKALVIGVAFSLLALVGCDNPVNDDPDTTDNFKGKTWKSGPNTMDMWNVWEFKNDGTFQFTHYHSADKPDPKGLYSYSVEDGVLYTTAPDGGKNNYSFTFAENFKSFAITSEPHSGGSAIYTLVPDETGVPESVPDFSAFDLTDTARVIGYSAQAYPGGDKRAKEIALGDLTNDALAWYIRNIEEEEIAFAYTNGGAIQTDGLSGGAITIGSAKSNVAKSDALYIYTLTGAQIKTRFLALKNDRAQVSREVQYTIDLTDSDNVQITAVTINGQAINDTTQYRIASSQWNPTGKTGYEGVEVTAVEGVKLNETVPYYIYALQTSEESPLQISGVGRITVVGSEESGGGGGHTH